MAKTILILLDGCGYDVAAENLGFLEHLVEHGLGAKYHVRGELPSSSRPIYATLLTGLPVYRHGIHSNAVNHRYTFDPPGQPVFADTDSPDLFLLYFSGVARCVAPGLNREILSGFF